MYHGTVWSLHEVPQRWKWQSLNILVVVYRHDRDFTGTHPSNQRGRLNATPGIRTSHDPMLLRRDALAAHNPPIGARLIHARRDFSSASLLQPLRKNPCRSNFRRNDEQGHIYARETRGFSLKPFEQILIDGRV